ncbi:hypothetical protein KBB96_02210 [Luteolibacter ambystomatis]|uniref:Uncharacterized protein n=1 Tax=Luteolibacter ambystomatis TaxID=2824561 RepID=A0A975PEY0_9BACT|nr:hypothetical protein [Luteolibacter ambystomatis]QUE51713.1 hypothetical protein KBB96_02210 [Luteolibacter ambystomatis]
MNPSIHSILTTLRRFRWEIAIWLLLSVWQSIRILRRDFPEATHDMLYRGFRPEMFESVAACWLILRLGLSETMLRTQGGWRTRPMAKRMMICLPLVTYLIVFLPPLLFRAAAIGITTSPDLHQWGLILFESWLTPLGTFGAGAIGVYAIGCFLTWFTPRWRKRLIVTLVVALVAIVALLPYRMFGWISYSGQADHWLDPPWPLDSTVRATSLAGVQWIEEPHGLDGHRIASSLLTRLPLQPGAVTEVPGEPGRVTSVRTSGDRVEFDLEFLCANNALARQLQGAMLVVKYADGDHADCLQRKVRMIPSPVPLCPVNRVLISGSAASPRMMPWSTLKDGEELRGAELLIYVADMSATVVEAPREQSRGFQQQRPTGLEGRATRLLDDQDLAFRSSEEAKAYAGRKLPAGLVPFMLKRHPWSDFAWDNVIGLYLLEHAAETDKPALLERMTTDPRLGGIFLKKGWRTEAMPLLRNFAKERITLDATCLQALAEEKDPALSADLAALAMRLGPEVETLEAVLKAQPNFDWSGFAKNGWKRVKYLQKPDDRETMPTFATWAAREGDVSALRYLAEEAAHGEEDEKSRVAAVLESTQPDVIGFLRSHIDQLEWNRESGKFRLK